MSGTSTSQSSLSETSVSEMEIPISEQTPLSDVEILRKDVEVSRPGAATSGDAMPPRTHEVRRTTHETDVRVQLAVDGERRLSVSTGIGFLDHMVRTLAFHACFDLELECSGDLEVDDHHTAEDAALALGEALSGALGDMAGIARFGDAFAPLDEALARCVVDCSGRPHATLDLGLSRERIGTLATENVPHFFRSFAQAAGITLHVDVLRGENDHHRAEAAFKATALALRQAVGRIANPSVPSTKGRLR